MGEKTQDLYLPNAVITKIVREALPDRVLISKEARPAISKAASSFILYVTSLANAHCESGRRKTIIPADIINALKEMQFGHFEAPLMQYLEHYRAQKFRKSAPADGAEEEANDEAVEEDEIIEEVDIEDVLENDLLEEESRAQQQKQLEARASAEVDQPSIGIDQN